MDTFTNLVRYKGHNYPVWDVDFASTGFYFATASHDRTARLWSCDQIHPLRIFVGHLSDVDVSGLIDVMNYFLFGCCCYYFQQMNSLDKLSFILTKYTHFVNLDSHQ